MTTHVTTFVRSIFSWVLAALLLAGIFAAFYYFNRFDEELRHYVETTLARQYPNQSITIASAHMVRGESIRVRGLSIAQPASQGQNNRIELAFCEEVVLHCNPTMQEFLQGKVEIPHVELRRLTLNPTRENDGSWNFEDLLPSAGTNMPTPTVSIQDANVELIDRKSSPPSVLILRKLNASLTPTASNGETADSPLDMIDVWATFDNDHARGVSVRGWIDPQTLAWSGKGKIVDLRFTPELLQSLPEGAQPQLEGLSGLRARANLQFSAEQTEAESVPRYHIEGSLLDGRLELPQYRSAPLTDVRAKSISLDNNRWEVLELVAQYETAQLNLNARGQHTKPGEPMSVWGSAQNLNITERIVSMLPARLQAQWKKYRPLGTIDGAFRAIRNHDQWWVEAHSNCRDLTLVCEKFSYPLVNVQGTVRFRQNERLDIDLRGSHDHTSEERPVHIVANILRPGPDFYGTVQVESNEWMRLDRRMVSALKPKVRQIISDMEAHCEVRASATFRRAAGERTPAQRHIVLDIRNGSLRHERFPYPLSQVRGRIQVRDEGWSFEQFIGSNDSGVVRCNGRWVATPPPAMGSREPAPGELTLHFDARDIPCDAELEQALPDGPRRIWTSLRPTGALDHAEVELFYRSGMEKPELDVRVTQLQRKNDPERRSLEVQPTWFPLRMDRVTGSFVYQRNGTFQLRDIGATHGSSQRSFDLQLQGGGEFRPNGSWVIQLQEIHADGVEMTPEVKAALPDQLRGMLTQLAFAGRLSVTSGAMQFAGSSRPNSPIQSNWRLPQIDIDNGSLRLAGTNVEHLFGQISVAGQNSSQTWLNVGEAQVETMMCKGVQVTEINTPWRMEPTRLLFGLAADTGQGGPRRHLRARLFGGLFQADGEVALRRDHDFRIDMQLADFQAGQVAEDLNMPTRISGLGHARLELNGNGQGTHSLSGRGNVALRNANLARLPAIIALLNTIDPRATSPEVFSSSDILFSVQGPHLNLDSFDLHGDSLSLKGQGWISLDRQIDLEFHALIGGESRYNAMVRKLIGQASKQLMLIRVSGSMDNLRWSSEVLPGLNDSLQQLFAEPDRTADVRRAPSQN